MPACLADVGERVRVARKAARIEQRALAASVGVTQAGVSRWECGQRDPGVAALIRVAEALGVPASSLLPAGHQGASAAISPSGGELIAFGLLLERAEADLAEARAQIAHLSAALAGDNEGVRLWMLDCARLVSKHRDHATEVSLRLARIREGAKAFFAQYGDSELPTFKVAQDLASSILKTLDRDVTDAADGDVAACKCPDGRARGHHEEAPDA
jgi:transcriptional regulator with XRE-family HTH domain